MQEIYPHVFDLAEAMRVFVDLLEYCILIKVNFPGIGWP